ncbi:MAG: pantoate--beta-alanine ligase [Actinobacteria bacterium]|nr:pantoate--beta-alanine ligase [Actinomycetota bacterium]
MHTITNPSGMRKWATEQRQDGHTIGLVPTMGALHAGHLALIAAAKAASDLVVVSIFVNPLQFDGQSDLDKYPRQVERDIGVCTAAAVDVVYAPAAASMYPPAFQTRVLPGPLAEVMEGTTRSGHFEGVTTVVTKLFNAVQPDRAFFGEKDYQQLTIIRQLTADLDLGIEIVGHPTVREPDGLARSSRNVRLSTPQRKAAICLPRALDAAVALANQQLSSVPNMIEAAKQIIAAEPEARLDYISVFDAATLQPVVGLANDQRQAGRVRIGCAVLFGEVRLIDNRDPFSS